MVMWRDSNSGQTGLVDILDRVLDKGLVVAGDIQVTLANVELLTIKIRLLVCSVDKAQEIGMDWWRRDGFFSTEAERETKALQARVQALEAQLSSPVTPQTEQADAPAQPQPSTQRRRRRS